jgi:hypothetical protein
VHRLDDILRIAAVVAFAGAAVAVKEIRRKDFVDASGEGLGGTPSYPRKTPVRVDARPVVRWMQERR